MEYTSAGGGEHAERVNLMIAFAKTKEFKRLPEGVYSDYERHVILTRLVGYYISEILFYQKYTPHKSTPSIQDFMRANIYRSALYHFPKSN